MFENVYGVIIRNVSGVIIRNCPMFGQLNTARVASSSVKISPCKTYHLGSFLLDFGSAVTSLGEEACTIFTACPSCEIPGCTNKFIQRIFCMIIQLIFSFSSIACLLC